MKRPLQPQFKIRIFPRRVNSGGHSPYIDVETQTSYDVTYREQADLITTLNFTIDKNADVLLQRCYIGMRVEFYATTYSSDIKDAGSMLKLFVGTVTRIRTKLPDNGRISSSLEAFAYGYNELAKDSYQNFVYPDPSSKRAFAKGKEAISLRDVIIGVAEDRGMKIGDISMSPAAEAAIFTRRNPRYQKNQSDWKFLRALAKSYGCSIWFDVIDGEEYLYFVDITKAKNKVNDRIRFLYPLNGVNKVTDIKQDEMIVTDNPSYDRPRILRECSIDEDVAAAYSVTRSAVFIDKETGEEKDAMTRISEEDGKKVTYMYEFDEKRVEQIDKDNPELAERIRNMGATDIPFGSDKVDANGYGLDPNCASYYYKRTQRIEEDQAVFDQTWFGVTINATCNLDLNIHTQRSYAIRGIVRYDSNDIIGRYYLRALTHVWGSSGSHTELEFIR